MEALLRESIYQGQRPARAEVDALKLPDTERRRFDAAVTEGLTLWENGARGAANETALHASKDIVADLPDRLRDPAYGHRDPFADVTDPAELAAGVARNGITVARTPATN